MLAPVVPSNEPERLASLERSGLLKSGEDPRFTRIVSLAAKMFKVPTALISLVTEDEQRFKAKEGLNVGATPRNLSFCGHVVARAAPMVVEDATQDARFFDNPLVTGPPDIRFYAGHPIYFEGQILGTLCLISPQTRRFSEEDAETLASLASWVENEVRLNAITQERNQLSGELEVAHRQAMTDHLTGAWTRRILPTQVASDVSRRTAVHQASTAVAVDLDCFKGINDELGHDVGDAVLVELVARLGHNLRSNDLVIRLGGDEFLLYLGSCPLEEAEKLAARLLDAICLQPVVINDELSVPISISLGIGSSNQLELDALIALADDALYDSKRKGRRCYSSRQLYR
ncbi:diguanylate cyclase [Gallaecimonas pentaromativorans]|uniref:sensor domain-containing diguanylate cyclase n=1 Tax=Gallaecimonas pentaromativorans TaxID=584787 RepID=UPI003A94EFD8